MHNKEKNKIETRRNLSTPAKVYVIASICAVVFLIISVILSFCKCNACNCSWWSNLFLNVGYGTVASILVTLFVDIGNTKRQRIIDHRMFIRLNASLKELCADLPCEMNTAVYEAFGYDDNDKRTFAQWSQKLFSDGVKESEKQKREIDHIIQQIAAIKKEATQLKSDLRFQPNNQYVTSEFEEKLKRLLRACSRITLDAKTMQYPSCARTIAEDFGQAVVDLYEELSADYSCSYNEEDFIE